MAQVHISDLPQGNSVADTDLFVVEQTGQTSKIPYSVFKPSTVTVDSALDTTSTNPVQNGVITTNINKLKAVSVSLTLAASSWSGSSAPYTYNLATYKDYFTEVFENVDSISAAQHEALVNADISQGCSSVGYLYAWGDKPSLNIPVTIKYTVA